MRPAVQPRAIANLECQQHGGSEAREAHGDKNTRLSAQESRLVAGLGCSEMLFVAAKEKNAPRGLRCPSGYLGGNGQGAGHFEE